MKRSISVLLTVVLLVTSLVSPAGALDGITIPTGSLGGLQPASFKNVEYKLRDGVVRLDSGNLLSRIKTVGQVDGTETLTELTPREIIRETGYVKQSDLQEYTDKVLPGTIFVDEKNKTAFKIGALSPEEQNNTAFSGYASVEKTQVREVLDNLVIPEQDVILNQANIYGYGEGIEESIVKTEPGKTYIMSNNPNQDPYSGEALEKLGPQHIKRPIIELKFPNRVFKAYTRGGKEVKVTLSGYLGIDQITAHGKYTGFSGYQFYLRTGEEAYLKAVTAADINEEVAIPLFGVDVDAKVARVTGGIFLIVGIDGKFTLTTETRQWTMVNKFGIRGGTFSYVPTSFKPLFELGDRGITGDARFAGAVNGYVKIGPKLSLEIFGWEAAGAGAFFGGGAECTVANGYIDARVFGLMQVYAVLLDHRLNLINVQPTLFNKRQINMNGFIINFQEACAFRNAIWGTIERDEGTKGVNPYFGSFNLLITDANGKKKLDQKYNTKPNGSFTISKVNPALAKGDQIYVTVEGNKSVPITPSFPFKSVVIDTADYFNDFIEGHVPTAVVKNWDTGEFEEIRYPGKVTVNVGRPGKIVIPRTITVDAFGRFRIDQNILPTDSVSANFTYQGFSVFSINNPKPSVDFVGNRVAIPTKVYSYSQNGSRIDSVSDKETFIAYNLRGSRQILGNAEYQADYKVYKTIKIATNAYSMQADMPISEVTKKAPVVLNKYFATEPGEGGASFATNAFNTEWQWPKETRSTIGSGGISLPTAPSSPARTISPTTSPGAPTTLALGIPITAPSLPTDPSIPVQPPASTKANPATVIPAQFNPYKIPATVLEATKVQNTFNYRYLSKDARPSFPGEIVGIFGPGYLKRTGSINFTYEGQVIPIVDPDDAPPKAKGKKTLYEESPQEEMSRYLARYFWYRADPMPIGMSREISNIRSLPAWAAPAVTKAVNRGVMDLGVNQAFKNGYVTRGEAAAYLAKGFGLESVLGPTQFSDIPSSHPYIPEINAAVKAGLITGNSSTNFGAFGKISREQMATIIMRGLKAQLGSRLNSRGSGLAFKDMSRVSSWASQSVNDISALGIMQGSEGSFRPANPVTFNEMAVIMNNLDTFIAKQQ
ncbi:MAG TPA: S-layer homology domain-containing protein [Bacillota bacterium]|nr:S-layer homology domain-containing protein [Bacillota bacterium]